MKVLSYLFIILVMIVQGCTKDEVPLPLPPTDLIAISISESQIDLAWINISTNAVGYRIERRIGNENYSSIATVSAEIDRYNDTGLAPLSFYTYRIYAYNSGGNSLTFSNTATATTQKPPVPILVSTIPLSYIGSTSALSGVNINQGAFPPITAKGVVWNTSANPTDDLTSKTIEGDGNGNFSYGSILTGLAEGAKYFVRAYATNAKGTVYGNELTFTTTGSFYKPGSGVSDIDGNAYKSVILGSQEWMAENLRTTKYVNGEDIKDRSGDALINWNNPIDAWTYFQNNNAYNNSYGKLYNWYAVTDTRNLCPSNWHVPNLNEWTILFNYLGGEEISGVRLKESIGKQWGTDPATNESGLNGLASGNIAWNATPFKNAMWWTSTPTSISPPTNDVIAVNENQFMVQSYASFQYSGFSVRCIKD